VPEELSRIISKATARNPNNRHQTAAEFISDLDTFLE